jgi:diacylglycerol O-acyltransferase / wax synthase
VLWREIVLGLAVFALYALVESASGREAAAQRHGALLLRLERAGHIAVEQSTNRWLAGHNGLRILANYEYALTYVITAFWLLAWLYWRRPGTYRWARDSFVVLNLIGIMSFALYPTAPPRLLTGESFVDTVSSDHTWGSWGSPLVTHANQLAAMPSLHVAWALWVTVVLARVSSARSTQAASVLHVLLTVAVIVITANHYLLDAGGAVLLVVLTFGLMSLVRDAPGQEAAPRVAAADAFFLYAESPAWPQHVGGAVVLGESGPAECYRDRLRTRIEQTLPQLPRFAQQLSAPARWRRPRWVNVARLDWDWHVPVHDVSGPDGAPAGVDALHRHIARLQSELLPRDRPLWRFVVVTGFAADRVAAVLLVHHSVADGIGTVAQAARLLDPVPALGSSGARPGALRRGLGILAGLAQLATDGRARGELPSDGSGERRFGTLCVPLERLRRIAHRYQVRVTDVLLSASTAALTEVLDGRPLPARFRVATPLMVRTPDSTAEGNVTAAVIARVPLGAVPEPDRLARTARETHRLHTGARALASRFVLSTGIALLPPALQAAFARSVYGHRFFQAIVSNMPGPSGGFRMAGAPMLEVYPVLPLASRAPLVVGVLTWDDIAHFGVTVVPGLTDDAGVLVAAIARALDALDTPDPLAEPQVAERVSSDPGASVSTTPPRQ